MKQRFQISRIVGLIVVCACLGHTAHAADGLPKGAIASLTVEQRNGTRAVAISPDNRTLAFGDGTAVKLWDIRRQQEIVTFEPGLGRGGSSCLAFSPDGETLAIGAYDVVLKLWSIPKNREITTLHSLPVWAVAFSPNDGSILAVSGSSSVDLWNTTERRVAWSLIHQNAASVAFSQDGKIFVSGGGYSVELSDVSQKQGIASFDNNRSSVASVAITPDQKVVASAGAGVVRLWDVDKQEEIGTLTGHTGDVQSVTFSPDSAVLFGGSNDGTITLWSVANREELTSFEAHKDEIYTIALSADGQMLASTSKDQTVRVWDVKAIGNLSLAFTQVSADPGSSAPEEPPVSGVARQRAETSEQPRMQPEGANPPGLRPAPAFTDAADRIRVPQNAVPQFKDALAVILGIETYREKDVPPANFAKRDALSFYEYARSVFGIPEPNIQLATDELASMGTFDKIFNEHGWLSRAVRPGETEVFIFYSGHGAPAFKKSEEGNSVSQLPYLIPYDASPNYALATGVSLQEICDRLSTLGAKHVTLFIDACFSGGARPINDDPPPMLLADARPIFTTVEGIARHSNITLITASEGAEISSGHPLQRHGLFSYYLMTGLQGEADANNDRAITVRELVDYLQDEVRDRAWKLYERKQTPTLQTSNPNRVLARFE